MTRQFRDHLTLQLSPFSAVQIPESTTAQIALDGEMRALQEAVAHDNISLRRATNAHGLTNFGFDLLALKRAFDNFQD